MSKSSDPYPEETLSFSKLPTTSPVNHLCYGILTELVAPRVKEIRKEKQTEDRENYVKQINLINLKGLQRSINIPKVVKYGSNKREILNWFSVNEIPLIYLKEMYEQQLAGPPKLEPNDYICINENKNIYGRVREVWGKRHNQVHYDLVHYDGQKVHWTTPVHLNHYHITRTCYRRKDTLVRMGKDLEQDLEEFLLPDELVFRSNPYDMFDSGYTRGVSIWKCKKVGHNDNWQKEFDENKKKIMDEIHFRQRFWLESIYLRDISFQAFYGWFDTKYDIIGKKERPPIPRWHVTSSDGVYLNEDELWRHVVWVIDGCE